jgi:hypothetical protein
LATSDAVGYFKKNNFELDEKSRVIVDIVSPFEAMVFILLASTIFIFFIPIFSETEMPWFFYFGMILLVGLLFKLVNAVSFYWLLDLQQRKLIFHRKIINWIYEVEAARFADLTNCGVIGRHRWDRSRHWWEYRVVLCNKRGKTFVMSDWQEGFGEMNILAKNIAAGLGIEYLKTIAKRYLHAKYNPQKNAHYLEYYESSLSNYFAYGFHFWLKVFLAIILLIIYQLLIGV